ncbi:MAG: hypothetical protein GX312_05615 [Candidatus Phytoplasma sp.]|nr:hypothetical protein [Phytoplasma sp.]
MKKIYAILLLILGGIVATQPVFAYENTGNNVVFFEQTEGFESFVWYNDSNNKVSTFNLLKQNMFDEYYINVDEAQMSSAVYVQRENVHYGERRLEAPEGYGFNEQGQIGLFSNDVFKESTFTHPKGYIRFTTKAYQIGFYDGGIVYHIEVDAEIISSFFIQKRDNLVIQHGSNAVTYDGIVPEGEIFYELRTLSVLGGTNYSYFSEKLQPNYSAGSGGGLDYEFLISSHDYQEPMSMKSLRVTGNHYLIATNTTEVLPTYVHNYQIFDFDLDLSYGPIGVPISSDAMSDKMIGTIMTLPGYDDRIKTSVLKLQPESLGFEPQYFFYGKTSNHSINGWDFQTNRLRTGYIEDQYINLSAYRSGAGSAYLEFKFEKDVHEFTVDLAFWSSNEKFSAYDRAVIEYKNRNNEWVLLMDILDRSNNVPTNRNNPRAYTFFIISGAKEIRITSSAFNPSGSRNYGRISIGNLEFVSFEK